MISDFEPFGIAGIFFELLGFFFMLKFHGKSYTYDDYRLWEEKNPYNKDDPENYKLMNFVDEELGTRTTRTSVKVSKRFLFIWNMKTKFPIFLVMFGLFLQFIQLLD